ncbi:K+-transporting ATPase KdpF subunit [Erwinia toletana]|uniref:K+-transporting ATPase KdpF subunit n=1 Tax=Winslowiella toletana TaxID=92490 RepID=A0ABS4PDS5_9GAMM|nr:potassium-transporting ATPase subunit F [Winslowiella toletana]MBP2170347.1 K+-transporting ATPase KdpF subunit [Winslowiella toletana]
MSVAIVAGVLLVALLTGYLIYALLYAEAF